MFLLTPILREILSSHKAVLHWTWERIASITNRNLTMHFLAELHFMRIFAA